MRFEWDDVVGLLEAFFLALILFVVMFRWCSGRRNRVDRVEFLRDLAPSLRRRGIPAPIRAATRSNYAQTLLTAQANGPANAPDIATASQAIQEAGGFHARDIVSQWNYRHGVQALFRMPTDERVRLVRQLFVEMGAPEIGAKIQVIVTRIINGNGNWFQAARAQNIAQLNAMLNGIRGNLFGGHRSGNFQAGTLPDLTSEAMAQIGAERLGRVNSAAVELLEHFGMEPFVEALDDQFAMSFSGAMPNLRGPAPQRRTQETRLDPNFGLTTGQTLRTLARARIGTMLRWGIRYRPKTTLVLVMVLVLLIGYELVRLLGGPEVTGKMGSSVMKRP